MDSRFKAKPTDLIVNWGSSKSAPQLTQCLWINNPQMVSVAANKINTLRILSEHQVPTVPWTTDINQAKEWLDQGNTVYVRHKLTGHSGDGIEVVVDAQLPQAPLYTRGIGVNKRHEYRVHVCNGEVIHVQKKKRKHGWEQDPLYSGTVRNHHSGWIYAVDDVVAPLCVKTSAINSVLALGLDFGAVDIIYMAESNAPYVLEVNTAPGLDGESTIVAYATSLRRLIDANFR